MFLFIYLLFYFDKRNDIDFHSAMHNSLSVNDNHCKGLFTLANFDAKTLSKMPATATEQSTLSDVTTETIFFEFAAEESKLSLLRAFLKVFLLQNLPVSMLLYQQIL